MGGNRDQKNTTGLCIILYTVIYKESLTGYQSSATGITQISTTPKTMPSTEKVEQDENHTFHLVSTINKLAIDHQQTTALGDRPLHTH